jgi:hypothetical protein
MKKLVLTTAILMAIGSTSVFAHHPAADIVDPDIYAMIDENVSETPHADMTFDDMNNGAATATGTDMNGDTSDVGAATVSADGVRNEGAVEGGDFENVGAQISSDPGETVGDARETREIENARAEMTPKGPGKSR